ncbi:MAG TPA: DoxX family protein [Bryobacteraceae bacterium]|nr:DoxX family protein [Bryobacteraceae bacterium]
MGHTLQRLFSTFPNSWPGVGLLLIRVSLSLALFYFGSDGLPGKLSEPTAFAQKSVTAIGGVFLLAGLWTPPVGVLLALNEFSIALSFSPPQRGDTWLHFFFAVIAVSLAMLGPGAWSIDARLFGRQRFDLDRNKGKKLSP